MVMFYLRSAREGEKTVEQGKITRNSYDDQWVSLLDVCILIDVGVFGLSHIFIAIGFDVRSLERIQGK